MPTRASLLLLALALANGACLEESPRQVGDVAADVAPPCTESARECVSYDAARVCLGGVWQTEACGPGQICERADAECRDGQYTCLGVLLCNFDCPDNDNACTSACNQGATVDAVDDLLTLNNCQCQFDCWPWLCGRLFPIRDDAGIAACVATHCPLEGAACVGQGTTGTKACDTVRKCILDDCGSDTFCAEACFGKGDPEAQTIAGFYFACVRDACGAEPEAPCLLQAQSNDCAEQWQACTKDVAGEPSVPPRDE